MTFPGILIGTAGVTTAYAGKWFTAPPLLSCTAVERVAPAKSSFTLNVLNAGAVSGEAGVVASELRKRGYAVGSVSNDDVLRSVDGSGEIRYGRKGYDQALYVQQLVPSARLVEVDRPTTAVDLVLGPDYKALTPRPARPRSTPRTSWSTSTTRRTTRTSAPPRSTSWSSAGSSAARSVRTR
ncbi:LytR C-terminal domain-containing protein [Arsenicicoccus piscis]|uniref:LytR C-terminal domain-containing protein n=1 Tax=Arsenicicoccus piscis TaxID=673954 RepID=UPI0024E04B3D|nr:LytR C-terminal domain-containing protein [Arsenicicoccus piscis]